MSAVQTAMFNKRLKSILVRSGLMSEDEAIEASEQAQKDQTSLSRMIVEGHRLDERTLVGAISTAMNIPPIDLAKVEPSADALESMPQDMAVYYGVLPVAKVGDLLTIAVANPFDIVKLDDVHLVTGCELRPVVSTDVAIERAIARSYSPGEREFSDIMENVQDLGIEVNTATEPESDTLDMSEIAESEDSPVIKLVNLVIYQAIKAGASDIHIEPFEKRVRIRFRQDGVLNEISTPPKRMQNAIVSRVKVICGMDIAERRKPQDGKFQLRVDGRQVDFRVSVLPVVHGEKVVLRILDAGSLALSLDGLGFEEKALSDFRTAIEQPWGMILVTGPTGSGKSTTLYSSLKEVLSDADNIVTVEDPVEYQLEGINQVPVNVKRGLTFAAALRSILRQDPDIVMIGEIRDSETADIAVKAALTGHLVLSTLHTNDSPSSITRLVDMGVDPFMVASSVVLVSAQRLARKLCEQCKEPFQPKNRDHLIRAGFLEEEIDQGLTLFQAKGCGRCTDGYKGRFALLETLPVSDNVKRMITDGASSLDVKKRALEEGMLTLRRCGVLNAIRGRTSIEEVLRVTMMD
jgi:type IV pilus assembly protein PilB